MLIKKKPSWFLSENRCLTESEYRNRRTFLKELGLLGTGLMLTGCSAASAGQENPVAASLPVAKDHPLAGQFPAAPNTAFTVNDRPMTEAVHALQFNNFYEFTTDKAKVHQLAQGMPLNPWEIEVSGHCGKPGTYDLFSLVKKLGVEERVYRFRCVERWAMVVPWTGVPLAKVLKHFEPNAKAKYVRFVTASLPEHMPGIAAQPWYPWPYTEGLGMDEAMNELALLVTGLFGAPLKPQNGAPARLIVPWKYGYKSAKSIVKIEFTKEQPDTFWNTAVPKEYPFISNVDPAVPHPRWSQAWEYLIPDGGNRPTQPFNGYAEQVAHLYPKTSPAKGTKK